MLVIAKEELAEAARQDDADRAKLRGERSLDGRRQREVGLHTAVDAETQELLASESPAHKPPFAH